jgi:hypothetical protein
VQFLGLLLFWSTVRVLGSLVIASIEGETERGLFMEENILII